SKWPRNTKSSKRWQSTPSSSSDLLPPQHIIRRHGMSTLHSSWLWERLLYIVIMVLAIATLVYTGDAQPGNGDSLGPAAFPRYASGLLLCLMAVKILQARVGARRSTGQAKEP